MGEFADDVLEEIFEEVEMWETDGPPEEDGYPLIHSMSGGSTYVASHPQSGESATEKKEEMS